MAHSSITCSQPFCSDCWQIIRGNLLGVKKVADDLYEKGMKAKNPTVKQTKSEHTKTAN